MKLLFDFFPILIFFITYKFFGIFVATGVAIALSLLQLTWVWLQHRQFEPLHLLSSLLIIIFGGITLAFHNPIFIKWKPTLLYWCLALIFWLSQSFGKPILQRTLADTVTLPTHIWTRLNLSWIGFFSSMGALNLYVAHHYSTNAWVNFKLIGFVGCTTLFVLLQAFYLAKYTTSFNHVSGKK